MLWNYSTDELILSFAFITCFCFVCGWVADRIMGFSGFGAIGNWLMLTSGAYLGMYAFNRLGYHLEANTSMTIIVVSGSAALWLIFFTVVKSAIHS